MAKAKAVKARPPSPFGLRVYEICKAIPPGRVATYGVLSKILKTSPRAVGQSLRRNPFAPKVPCHRVVAADRSIGGFCGQTGTDNATVQKKIRMLEDEGVRFEPATSSSPEEAQTMVMPQCIMTVEELEAAAAAAALTETSVPGGHDTTKKPAASKTSTKKASAVSPKENELLDSKSDQITNVK